MGEYTEGVYPCANSLVVRAYFTSFFSQIGAKPVIAERTHDVALMRSLVANGFGYSIANVRPLNDLSADEKRVCYIPLVSDVRPIEKGLIMAEGARRSFTIHAFVDQCAQNITPSRVSGMNMNRWRYVFAEFHIHMPEYAASLPVNS